MNRWQDFNDASDVPLAQRLSREDALNALLARLEQVLRTLYPNVQFRQNKAYLGNIRGDQGRSLEFELRGDRAGLWFDHESGESGDLFAAWSAARGIDHRREFPALLDDIADWLGTPQAKTSSARADKAPATDELGPYTGKWDYVTGSGELIACVYRYEPEAGKKEFRPWDVKRRKQAAPDPRPLYNQPGLLQATQVLLVEGEKCADALIQLGIVATTAMQGAKAPVNKTDWSPLAGKSVLIWPDKDQPGWAYAEQAAAAAWQIGATQVAILLPPDDKPCKWDAADAVAEGFDVVSFVSQGERIEVMASAMSQDEDEEQLPAQFTEDAIAKVFAQRYGDDWRYVATWGKWLVWTGKRWQTEATLQAQHLSRLVCREIALQCKNIRTTSKLSSAGCVAAVERLARADRRIAATSDEWDSDPWLLNVPAGTIHLQTGTVQPHQRADRLTKLATASPHGDCPTWRTFLQTVTAGDQALQDYLARVAGYALTGVTTEHAIFFLYGTGANGKSVFLNTLATLLGEYATNAPMDTFMESKGDRHPTDMAGLRGARMVTSIETEQGRRWAESKVKALTGGDKISARFMRQDFFEFTPHFKLMVAGNHKPAIRNIDEAMKRRLHMIPFTVTIPPHRRDKLLADKLLAERDGILAWAVAGCLAWQQGGLCPPPAVLAATEEYFEAEDALGRWIDEHCLQDPALSGLTAALFADWKSWAESTGEFVGSVKRFADSLTSKGFEKWRNSLGQRGFKGLALKNTDHHYDGRYGE
ncbi:phage/plasmid primase, P4 family [Chitinibacter sp. GC72]|uniref:phage/plasmid primase, P4 family n=1 Tax=Chitinibacter sp. GC72 TaxID=1526917 RepID=UPI0012FB5182|nr:phage/plasmid primase, P4 family [Chitinibacter sp. GC72]